MNSIINEEDFKSEVLSLIDELDDKGKEVVKRVIKAYEHINTSETIYRLINDYVLETDDSTIQIAFSSSTVDDNNGFFTHLIQANKVKLIDGEIHSQVIEEVTPIFIACSSEDEYMEKLNTITKEVTSAISEFMGSVGLSDEGRFEERSIDPTKDNSELKKFMEETQKRIEDRNREKKSSSNNNKTVDLDYYRYKDKTNGKYKN